MGNCSFKGVVAAEEHHHHCSTRTKTKTKTRAVTKSSGLIRVLSDSGQILQFREPISVEKILTDFPGFGVFRQPGGLSSPISGQEGLVSGQLYYLLPLIPDSQKSKSEVVTEVVALAQDQTVKPQKCNCSAKASSPARMSSVDQLTNGSALEVLPSKGNGVWRVKLVINTRQLEEIFSEQVNTEALIEKMRSAASSSTESVTPRSGRSRNGWGVNWKPTLYSVFKLQNDSCSEQK